MSLIVGVLSGVLILTGIIIAIPRTELPSGTSNASQFNGAYNVFGFLKKDSPANELPTRDQTETKETTSPQNDRDFLKALAEAWQERRITLEQTASQTPRNAPPPKETTPQEIFSSLLGPKLTDALNGVPTTQPPRQSSYSSFSGESALWGGSGDVAKPTPIQNIVEPEYAIQKELHDYGNELGGILDGFVRAQGDQAALLDVYLQNKESVPAQEKLKQLTGAYATLAETLRTVIPPEVFKTNHEAMADGYASIGTYLWDITSAKTDGELYNKLIAYNTIAEDVARTHVTVITTLKAYGVTFAPGEPGNAFVFDGASGTSTLSL